MPKKNTIAKPSLHGKSLNKKATLTWSLAYTSDYQIKVQKKAGTLKTYKTIATIRGGDQNTFEDTNTQIGKTIKYRVKVSRKGKKEQTSAVLKLRVK